MAVKKVLIDRANRLYQMPPDLLDFIKSEKKPGLLKRQELIDLAALSWPIRFEKERDIDPQDLGPARPDTINLLKEELAGWLYAVHKLKAAADREIYVGGSVSGMIHSLTTAYIDYGDVAFVPDISDPLYRQAITAAGGEAVSYHMAPAENWRPNFDRVQTRLSRVARLLFLNSPHDPTGAVSAERELAELIWIASRENILVINDASHAGLAQHLPPSLLGAEGGLKVGLELFSLPQLFGLPFLPAGFAVGNKDVIRSLRAADRLRPSFIPEYYVKLAIGAVRRFPTEPLKQIKREMERTALEAGRLLEKLSLESCGLNTVPFVWARIEKRSDSVAAARTLFRRYRVLCIPGTAFGEAGQGYLRFSTIAPPDAYQTGSSRIKERTSLLKKAEDN